jgi:hypothetical protein
MTELEKIIDKLKNGELSEEEYSKIHHNYYFKVATKDEVDFFLPIVKQFNLQIPSATFLHYDVEDLYLENKISAYGLLKEKSIRFIKDETRAKMLDDIDANCLSLLIHDQDSRGYSQEETNFIFCALDKISTDELSKLDKNTKKNLGVFLRTEFFWTDNQHKHSTILKCSQYVDIETQGSLLKNIALLSAIHENEQHRFSLLSHIRESFLQGQIVEDLDNEYHFINYFIKFDKDFAEQLRKTRFDDNRIGEMMINEYVYLVVYSDSLEEICFDDNNIQDINYTWLIKAMSELESDIKLNFQSVNVGELTFDDYQIIQKIASSNLLKNVIFNDEQKPVVLNYVAEHFPDMRDEIRGLTPKKNVSRKTI